MSMVNGIFTIECNKCKMQHNFPAEEADFDFDGSDERQMGTENSYSWNSSFNCNCGNEIEFEYGVWEYPTGVFNDHSIEINEGTLIGGYSYDFSEEPETDEI